MLRKGFLRHKTPENIIRKDVEFSTPFPLFSIGLIYSWRVAPQQSSFTLQSNKAKISNLNYIYNLSKLVTTYLITKLKRNMKSTVLTPMMDAVLLRKRAIIETIIDQLKNICQVEHSRHRSPKNFFNNIFAALIAYNFNDKKPSLKIQFQDTKQLYLPF